MAIVLWALTGALLLFSFVTARAALVCESDGCIGVLFLCALLGGVALIQGLVVLPLHLMARKRAGEVLGSAPVYWAGVSVTVGLVVCLFVLAS